MKMIFNHAAPLLAGGLLSLAAIPALAGDGGSEQDLVNHLWRAGATNPALAHLDKNPSTKEASWLGVGVEESSEGLSAQLNLKPGEGLVVTFVATNSPAAGAGLQKNDVLVELDGQMLVDPEQLRKLVQMHPEGDTVSIELYRSGKKLKASAKLAKHAFEKAPPYTYEFSDPFFSQFFQKPPGTNPVDAAYDALQRQMDQAQHDLTNNSLLKEFDAIAEMGAKKDSNFMALQQLLTQDEQATQMTAAQLVAIRKKAAEMEAAETIRKARAAREEAMERAVQEANAMKQEQQAARQVIQEVLRQMPPSPDLESIKKKLGDLANGGVSLDRSTTVVVKNDGGVIRTIVKKDSSGTYLIVADPAKHLTAHDADGKLLFDGLIDSPEQQAKVPREVWKKVEPMLVELDQHADTSQKPPPQSE